MRLRTIGRYRNDVRNLVFEVGSVVDVPDDVAAFLTADAPGCFEPVNPAPAVEAPANEADDADEAQHSAIDEAPANRAVGRPRKRKTADEG